MALRTKNPKVVKKQAIDSIKEDVNAASSFIFTEYRGLTVEKITELRKKLRENGCTYKVVRNNFARIAFEECNIENAKDAFVGPTALVYVKEDANEAGKTLFEFAKDAPALVVKSAIIEGEYYDAQKFEEYSKLPGKKQLIAMFMSTLNATTGKFVRTLQAIVDKGGTGTAESATPAAAEAAPAESAPAEASADAAAE